VRGQSIFARTIIIDIFNQETRMHDNHLWTFVAKCDCKLLLGFKGGNESGQFEHSLEFD